MDGADVVNRLRNQGARLCDGCAVVELGLAHAPLEVARQQEEQWQSDDEQDAESAADLADDGEDGQDCAGVGNHADDAGVEQALERIDIVDEARGKRAGLVLHEEISGQARKPLAHGGAQAVRDLLPEDGDAGLFQRIDEATGRTEREVEQRD